jgi:hypothetical protein
VKGRQPRRDALHRANYTDGRTEVLHLDGFEEDTGCWSRESDTALQTAWLAATSVDPNTMLAATVDLGVWLAKLPEDDRALLRWRMAGFSLQELAFQTNRSVSAVFAKLLGAALAQQGDVVFLKRRKRTAASC